jgi:hypothetical protein
VIVILLLAVVAWVLLAALVVGFFHVATGAATPQRSAPRALAPHLDVEASATRAA